MLRQSVSGFDETTFLTYAPLEAPQIRGCVIRSGALRFRNHKPTEASLVLPIAVMPASATECTSAKSPGLWQQFYRSSQLLSLKSRQPYCFCAFWLLRPLRYVKDFCVSVLCILTYKPPCRLRWVSGIRPCTTCPMALALTPRMTNGVSEKSSTLVYVLFAGLICSGRSVFSYDPERLCNLGSGRCLCIH